MNLNRKLSDSSSSSNSADLAVPPSPPPHNEIDDTDTQSVVKSIFPRLQPPSILRLHDGDDLKSTISQGISQYASNISMRALTKIRASDTTRMLLSKSDALNNICKCFTGASLFVLPWAFLQSGMVLGAVSFVFLAFLTYYTIYWLVLCGHMHPTNDCPTYPDIAYVAFGEIGFYVAWLGILSMTMGVSGSYLIFIGSQLQAIMDIDALQQNAIILIVSVPLMGLSLFRSYRFLVPFNILGLFSLFFSVVMVIIQAAKADGMPTDYDWKYYNHFKVEDLWGSYPRFLGNAAFAFLIHSVILPIEESMKDRKKEKVSTDFIESLNRSIVIVTISFLVFAQYTYFSFGNETRGNIIDNLDSSKWSNKLVMVALCINLFFTYPLFLFPMAECLELTIFKFDVDPQTGKALDAKLEIKRNVLRILLILVSCGIAMIVPDFEKLTALTGAFGNNVLGLMMPPIMYFKLVKLKNKAGSTRNRVQGANAIEIKVIDRIIGYFATGFGIVMLVLCSYTFVDSLI